LLVGQGVLVVSVLAFTFFTTVNGDWIGVLGGYGWLEGQANLLCLVLLCAPVHKGLELGAVQLLEILKWER
jgi:hypothetical protein